MEASTVSRMLPKGDQQYVFEAVVELAQEHGRNTVMSLQRLSEMSGVPEKKIYDYDFTTGIAIELQNQGLICMSDYGANPSFGISSEVSV